MDPSRFQEIERLYEAARTRDLAERPAFLAQT
jgi:hypothetical protein